MPVVVPAELPTADIVIVVCDERAAPFVFVDPRVPQRIVDETLADLPAAMTGPAYALG